MTDSDSPYKPDFRLRPLGYSRRDVEVAFAEGRMALRHLRAQAADLREQLERLGGELAQTRSELETSRAREAEVQRLRAAAEQAALAIEDEARSRAREIVAEAEERAALTRGEASLRAEEISGQIDELLRVRDELIGSARAAAQRFAAEVARIERGEVTETAEPAGAHEAVPQPPRGATDAPGDGEARLFETRVEVDAGPFADFAELSSFERTLARVSKVQDVYIRSFADERAVIELTLVEPAALVEGLRDLLPHGFDVVAETDRSLKLDVVSALR